MEGNEKKSSIETIRQNCNNDWREARPDFLDRMKFLCMKDEMADVYFVFKCKSGEQARIPAHKFMLSFASEVFHKEFTYGIAADTEKRLKQVVEIEVSDDKVEIDAFKQMLIFIYNGFKDITLTGQSVFAVLYIAQKYIIKQLEKCCVDYLLRKLDADNVFALVQYCIDFEADKKLMEKCKQFLQFNTENALKTKSFNDISAKCLKVLLEQDCISVPEVDLFKAVLQWAQSACESSKLPKTHENLRCALGTELLGLVRFPTISAKDFANGIVPSKILTIREERDILMTHILDSYQPENPLPYSKIQRKSTGTIIMHLDQFDVIRDDIHSERVLIGNFFWEIKAMRWDPILPSDTPALGFFLRCRGKETEKPRKRANKQWSCVASADLIIKSCKAGGDDFTRKIEHEFKPSPDDDWGFTQFMELRQFSRAGFKDSKGVVTLVAQVTVHNSPHAMTAETEAAVSDSSQADLNEVGGSPSR